MARINYSKIEREFMTSQASIDELAKKYQVSRASLFRHAKLESWHEKRELLRQEQTARQIQEELVAQDKMWETVQNKMREVITAEWDKIRHEKRPNGSQVAALAKATKDAREMGIFGAIPIEEQKQEVIIHIDGAGDLSD